MSAAPVTKTDQVRQALGREDLALALRLAKDFRLGLSPEERAAIKRAHECQDPAKARFYQQIGQDPAENVRRGIEVLKTLVEGGKAA